jgi:hypothetical protein
MTVNVYVWKAKFGSTFNFLLYTLLIKHFPKRYHNLTSVGHASIEIKNNDESVLYISHRPTEDNSRKITTQNIPSSKNSITLEDEIKIRGYLPREYEIKTHLNENEIISFYNTNKEEGGLFYYYEPLDMNCCKVVLLLLKQGLGCLQNCSNCVPTSYSSSREGSITGFLKLVCFVWIFVPMWFVLGVVLSLIFTLIVFLIAALILLLISLILPFLDSLIPQLFSFLDSLIAQLLPSLDSTASQIFSNFILHLFLIFWLFSIPFFQIIIFSIIDNVWTPSHLVKFIRKLSKFENSNSEVFCSSVTPTSGASRTMRGRSGV